MTVGEHVKVFLCTQGCTAARTGCLNDCHLSNLVRVSHRRGRHSRIFVLKRRFRYGLWCLSASAQKYGAHQDAA